MCFPGYSYHKQFFLFIAFASIISAPPLRKILAAPLIRSLKWQSFYKEGKRKNLAVLAETPQLKVFFSAKLSSSNFKAVALTTTPENEGENQVISLETTFTLSLAGHIDMQNRRQKVFNRGLCVSPGEL